MEKRLKLHRKLDKSLKIASFWFTNSRVASLYAGEKISRGDDRNKQYIPLILKLHNFLIFKVYNVHKSLSAISPMFSIAAAFGNVHGVYKSGNVVLSPHLLGEHQKYIKEQTKSSLDKPTFLVMHGGSGSTEVSIENNHLVCLVFC